MQKKEKIEVIRRELRTLRHLSRSIDAEMEAERRHRSRLAWLRTQPPTAAVRGEIARLEALMAACDLPRDIAAATEMEQRYRAAMADLDPLDRLILTDSCINGRAQWKIGQSVGYSVEAVQKRLRKIVSRMAETMPDAPRPTSGGESMRGAAGAAAGGRSAKTPDLPPAGRA